MLRGQDVVEGLREWMKAELKEGPRQAYDLGKFFFTVSIGTVGAIATIEKLNGEPAMDSAMLTSLLFLTVSGVLALFLALPRVQRVGGDTDLQEKYIAQIRLIRAVAIAWVILWLAGLLLGVIAVRS